MQTLIEEMEAYAGAHRVPIMQEEGLHFMCDFIKTHHRMRILEIGSAIGYSALRMAMVDPKIQIVTIECDQERYEKAKEYIHRSACEDQITLLLGDALTMEMHGDFDMMFIDAAKAQYIKFFERYEKNVLQGGYIITDNLQFHGYVDHPTTQMSRGLRQLVKKIARFVAYLKEREDYDTTFLTIGDGIGISQKKECNGII